jgi:hypothetical protein
MAELKNNYAGVDFDSYKRDTEHFDSIVGKLKSRLEPKDQR